MRYRIIHACLSSKVKTYWTIKELIEKLAAHDLVAEKRSIERDFEAMRFDERLAYMAPIKYSKLHKGYYYTDPHFTIDTAPLTEEDLALRKPGHGIPPARMADLIHRKLTQAVSQNHVILEQDVE